MSASASTTSSLPDVQSQQDFRGRAIEKVGVTNIRFPLCFESQTQQHTVGAWQVFVSLAENKRGTHMSRFMEILSAIEAPQTLESLTEMCEQIRQRLDAEDAFLKIEFPWFVEKKAPVSDSVGKLDFDVEIEIARGTSCDSKVTIKVPATSLCPCSKTISDFGAHNQRCELTVSVRFAEGQSISLEELFQMAESSASAQVFSVIKRNDEKYVTETAYENPKFVEDSVRDLADTLQNDSRIQWFRCSSENFESIHSHNAFAQIESRVG